MRYIKLSKEEAWENNDLIMSNVFDEIEDDIQRRIARINIYNGVH